MNSRNRLKTISFIVNALISASLVGCGSTAPPAVKPLVANADSAFSDRPAYLQPLLVKMASEGQQNVVLNQLEIGSAAFYHDDIELARQSFDEALAYIESTFANNENALKARSLWHEEGRKDYRGEAYERAMAYYYRGLIYIIDGEFDNARASFTSALLQDAFAEEKHDRADFALMMYLIGWSSLQMGSQSLADEAWAELKQFRPDFAIPTIEQNVLVISETGSSPRKLADGVGHFELVYRRGKRFSEELADARVSDKPVALNTIESIYLQAATRGQRDMDKILANKAEFRNFNAQMGSTLAEVGNTTQVFSTLPGGGGGQVGTALSLIGVTQLILASNTKPRADTRYWKRLPDSVHLAALQLDSVAETGPWQFSYQDRNQAPAEGSNSATHVFKLKNGAVLVWNKSREL